MLVAKLYKKCNHLIGLLLCFFSFIIIMGGCKNELSPPGYAEWVENKSNGLSVSTTEENYIFSLQYKPVEYIVVMQHRKPTLPRDILQKEIEAFGDMQYFNFKISTKNRMPAFSDEQLNFPGKQNYTLSGMAKDISLVDGNDTLSCKIFHFENGNELLPYDNCVLAFEKRSGGDRTLLFNAEKLGLKNINISIKAKDINRLPKLKTI